MSSRHRYSTGVPENDPGEVSPQKTNSLPSTVQEHQKHFEDAVTEDEAVDESMDDGNVDSEDGSLMIADMQEGKDTDDTERDSGHSDDEDHVQLIYNGNMSQRQSKQFRGAGGNFAVFSVRAGGKTKNRTCEYCGVVKATPAALIRHVRKHTGEKPFVCQLCGKAYKAKRSLHLHQNSHHRDVAQLLPPNPSSQLAQAPLSSPVVMSSTTPAISEVTKSLLRETLESSRKARDGSTGNQILEPFGSAINSVRVNERLPTPNLVNLLTSDISQKMQHSDEPMCLMKEVVNLSKVSPNALTNFIVSPPFVKKEKEEVEAVDNEEEEEQAQDLSMQTMQKSVNARLSSSERRLKCELCNKSFKHDISRMNHMRTAHNIIISYPGAQLPKQMESFTLLEQKSGPRVNDLPHIKHEHSHQKQEVATDLSLLPVHSRKLAEATGIHVSQENVKMESLLANTDALVLDESDTLPYNVTSRMVQDFDVEKLILKGIEKSVLAEDGGNRRIRMTVSRETVLATRLDGINNVTGRQATVFKCHLCARVFSSMLRYHHHLPSHFDTEVQTYDCRYCEASFRSLSQIVKHLQCHREKFSGLNQSGAGLNSSALLLEEFHRKQKPDHGGTGLSNSSPAMLFSPLLPSDESLNGTPQLEPGERANGGYTCAKCRKSFSREYLLQRHMRIHQNQNMFYCPECESGFSGELDMSDHRRKVHDVKSTTEQLQYSNLLRNISESKQGLNARLSFISDNNNNSSSGGGGVLGSQLFPLVDMKAFDLRRGEAVKVRMSSEVTSDSGREEMVHRAMLERYKALVLAARGTELSRQAFPSGITEDQHKRKLDNERTNWDADEEEVRITKETEKTREMEHEKLKRKLAQEGMGDVTVVLPDAPPPDEASEAGGDNDRPTDLSLSSEPPSGVGFMARKAVPKPTVAANQNNHVPHGDYQLGHSGKMEREISANSSELARNGLKRPLPDSAETNAGTSSKSRRKTHKPQKINKGDKIDHVEGEIGEDSNNNKTTQPRDSFANSVNGNTPNVKGAEHMNHVLLSHLMSHSSSLANSEQTMNKISAVSCPSTLASCCTTALSVSQVAASCDTTESPGSGAIDLTITDPSKHLPVKLSATALLYQANRKVTAPSSTSSHSSSSSPPVDGSSKQESKNNDTGLRLFERSMSHDPAVFDSDSSQSQEITSAADLSKTSVLSLQIPAPHDGIGGCPQPQWKPGLPWPAEMSESLLGAIHGGQWNGKRSQPLSCTSKSRASSLSPAPSPTNSDASSSAEGRKVTTTSLSRTHSRLSIVNEPLDRNSLCKPQILDDGRSVYACVICHKQFLSLSDINRHMDFHEDIRPYKCKYCDYYARTNSQLKVHKLRHEGVREFCCRVCNYKGVTQSDLNRHMKSQVHLLRSNHVCSQCGEGFVTPKTLRDHVCCTGSSDKSFENSSANDMDDEGNNDEYEEDEIVNSETSQGSINSVSEDVAVEAV